ncbi:TetR/AcrR family transcriptional regulator [Luminiphilus sp. nBUS_16]|uniref:TetR/AcrR family transcriptional regulator n=1 Tax=Luminiphilus sp. nBUS_16 TaxID=3395315 RepID=UPI003EC012CC
MTAAISLAQSNLKHEVSDFKRRRIREEASHLFFQQGYEGTTLDAIAQRLDVTKPFLYTHYANKAELLYDICRTGILQSLAAIDPILDDSTATAADRLGRLVEAVLAIIFDYQEFIVVYEREEKNLDEMQAREIREHRSLFDHKVAMLLEQGRASAEFEVIDAVLTANTIGGMMTWVALWYRSGGKRTRHQIISHTLRMVFSAAGANQKGQSDILPLGHEEGGVKGVDKI